MDAFALASDGTRALAATDKIGTVYNFSSSDQQMFDLPRQTESIIGTALSANGTRAVLWFPIRSPMLLIFEDQKTVQTYSLPEQAGWAEKISLSKDGNWLACLNFHKEPTLWDISNPLNIKLCSFPEEIGILKALSGDGKWAITERSEGLQVLWNFEEPNKPQSSILPVHITFI